MGVGIAQAFLAAEGYQVVLLSHRAFQGGAAEEIVLAGKKKVAAALGKLVAKEKITQEKADAMLVRISAGTPDQLAGCDLVIEAVAEDMEVKKELFQQLRQICGDETIYASNTSSLSITEMSGALGLPMVGIHFFNPVPVMKLVEIIAGLQTPECVTNKIIEMIREIGKTPVLVKEGPGFVVNRILVPMINEGIGIYAEGLASAEDIDAAMKLGANHPMGPLELGDLIGLDVILAIMDTFHEEFGDQKYRAHPLLRQMVRGGLLGRKSGRGFYEYNK